MKKNYLKLTLTIMFVLQNFLIPKFSHAENDENQLGRIKPNSRSDEFSFYNDQGDFIKKIKLKNENSKFEKTINGKKEIFHKSIHPFPFLPKDKNSLFVSEISIEQPKEYSDFTGETGKVIKYNQKGEKEWEYQLPKGVTTQNLAPGNNGKFVGIFCRDTKGNNSHKLSPQHTQFIIVLNESGKEANHFPNQDIKLKSDGITSIDAISENGEFIGLLTIKNVSTRFEFIDFKKKKSLLSLEDGAASIYSISNDGIAKTRIFKNGENKILRMDINQLY